MIDIDILKPARSRSQLIGSICFLPVLEDAGYLITEERSDGMAGLQPGLFVAAVENGDIFFTGGKVFHHIDIGSECTRQIEFQLIAKRRSVVGQGKVDPMVGDITSVDIWQKRARCSRRSDACRAGRGHLVDQSADQLVIPSYRQIEFVLRKVSVEPPIPGLTLSQA